MSPAAFLESNPVQANLFLRHDDKNDACDAYITTEVSFDLTPLAELYQQFYGRKDEIILNVFDYFQDQPGTYLTTRYSPRISGSAGAVASRPLSATLHAPRVAVIANVAIAPNFLRSMRSPSKLERFRKYDHRRDCNGAASLNPSAIRHEDPRPSAFGLSRL